MLKIAHEITKANVQLALSEDLCGKTDITSALIAEQTKAKAKIMAKEDAILCGKDWVDEVYYQLCKDLNIIWHFHDGDKVACGDVIAEFAGDAKCLLTGERTALNFLQILSGTATLTNRFVREIKGTKAILLDTRKTLPGLRAAQKYAVRCGGGENHRMGLYDAFLIKENHIAAYGSIANIVAAAKRYAATKKIEIEVESLAQLEEAIAANVDVVMLDNFTLEMMALAVKTNNARVKLEVSGNVDLSNIKKIAATGVDFISVGYITKNAYAVDLSMRFQSN